jgi:hypothetical protein
MLCSWLPKHQRKTASNHTAAPVYVLLLSHPRKESCLAIDLVSFSVSTTTIPSSINQQTLPSRPLHNQKWSTSPPSFPPFSASPPSPAPSQRWKSAQSPAETTSAPVASARQVKASKRKNKKLRITNRDPLVQASEAAECINYLASLGNQPCVATISGQSFCRRGNTQITGLARNGNTATSSW